MQHLLRLLHLSVDELVCVHQEVVCEKLPQLRVELRQTLIAASWTRTITSPLPLLSAIVVRSTAL